MDVRPSPIAGRWYPGEAAALRASIEAFLAAARPGAQPERVLGLLVPHAGHTYSGAVAAAAFRAVQGAAPDLVAILCPSHFHDDGPVVTSAHAAYATPLGTVRVDGAALAALGAELGAALNTPPARVLVPRSRDREHAIEVELPFLQCALAPGFKLLPLMLNEQGQTFARALGDALACVARDRRVLLVASSDLSHYYPQALARQLDAVLLAQVAAFSPEGLLTVQASGRGQACGAGAIAAVMWAARALGADRAEVVAQSTSGEVNGDFEQVVGYGAAVVWRAPSHSQL